jgi:hypothetical protein
MINRITLFLWITLHFHIKVDWMYYYFIHLFTQRLQRNFSSLNLSIFKYQMSNDYKNYLSIYRCLYAWMVNFSLSYRFFQYNSHLIEDRHFDVTWLSFLYMLKIHHLSSFHLFIVLYLFYSFIIFLNVYSFL